MYAGIPFQPLFIARVCSLEHRTLIACGFRVAHPDDVPSGEYTPSSVPPGLGNLTSFRLEVEHFTDVCMVHLFFQSAVLQLLLHETGKMQVEETLLTRYGLKKCLSMNRGPSARNVSFVLAEVTSMRRRQGIDTVVLCTKKKSTKTNPQLTLYLQAITNGRNYEEFNLPVTLTLREAQHSDGAAPLRTTVAPVPSPMVADASDGDPPPNKRSRITLKPAVKQSNSQFMPAMATVTAPGIKDGLYTDFFTSVDVITDKGGHQLLRLTSTTRDNAEFILLEGALVPMVDGYTTGCSL
ncbi:hypothetical protein FOZ63_008644 [Perkinsus olseni]|uniref:Uncharacterized protein n=1 Tax=Perkinsus olseni TaxID=32597 RepID=A0A7J6R4K0_PEROL|nr:hypothetical protein FOZ63_008644 [Perkinsus olseni]KAF4728606.1 hypothetical protein FOZ62_010701 [Perkinsus olseni]